MDINWLAIVAAVVANMVLGFVWYHPKVFGTAWMKSINKTQDELMQGFNPGLTYSLMIALGFILALYLKANLFVTHMENNIDGSFHTFKHGAFHSAALAIAIVAPVTIINGMFERKSFKNMFIHIGYWIVSFAIMGGIVDVWK
ncbi:MAG: DUF1761 domain-containing protein [Saprospiraceae bacterium]|nr:DUF1761 domain-containing protein [Saprospiraceae bacterium]